MTRDEIKDMLIAAGGFANDECSGDYIWCFSDMEDVAHFAKMIIEAEREECANLCDAMAAYEPELRFGAKIRARGLQ